MGWWTFDAPDLNWTTGVVLDRSGYGNNGTLTNMATKTAPTTGKLGQGLLFDYPRRNDQQILVETNASISSLTKTTISVWMKPRSYGESAAGTILDKGGWRLGYWGGSFVYQQNFSMNDGRWRLSVAPKYRQWSHVVVSYDRSTLNAPTFYVNGTTTAIISESVPMGTANGDAYLKIGNLLGVARQFDGSLDDIRIYNRILTPTEVARLYKEGQVTVNSFTCGQSTVKDVDGNVYNTVKIGTQCWMKQNMRVGTMVTAATTQTDNSIIEKHCYSNTLANCMTNNNPNYPDGGLYQWNEAMQYSTTPGARGICPAGWHIPTHDEFTTLERAVCASGSCATDFPYDTTTTGYRGTNEGTKLKPNGTSLFEGNLGGGMISGSFTARGTGGFFWSSVESGGSAWIRDLESIFASIGRATSNKSIGSSVRCLQN